MKIYSKKVLTLIVAITVIVASFASALSALAYVSTPPEGTEDKGIVNVEGGEQASSISGQKILITKYQKNGDFEQGLKYWTTTESGSNVYPTKSGAIKTEGGNKYFQFNGASGTTYRGLRSVRIGVPKDKLNAGDNIVVMFDYLSDGTDKLQVKAYQRNPDKELTNSGITDCSVLKSATVKSAWKTLATKVKNTAQASTTAASETEGIAAGDYVFDITAAVFSNETCKSAIDNIRLAKLADGKYYDIETGKEITFAPVSDEEDLSFGTEEEGFKATGNINIFHKPLNKPLNLDFSNGLRYWAGGDGDGQKAATDYVQIKTNGNNKYLNLKSTAEWGGITSPVFKIDGVNAGDEVTLVYDRKLGSADQKYQIYLSQIMYGGSYTQTVSIDGFNGRVATDINGAKEVKAAGADGWGTYALPTNCALKVPAGADKGIYLRISIQTQDRSLPANVDFDNFRIAKVSSDGVYTDVLTNTVINPKNNGGTTGGTTGGSTTGGSGTGASTGKSNKTGESVTLLVSLFALSAAGVFGTAKALKKR